MNDIGEREVFHFLICSDIENLILIELSVDFHDGGKSVQIVAGYEGGDVYGIFSRTERRCIREIESRQIADRRPKFQSGRDHIDAFIDACFSDGLGAQNPFGFRIISQFEEQ